MKGFIRILESIIASIILITSMTFFLTPGVLETGWDETMLQMEARDVLFSINENLSTKEFIKLNDIDSLNNKFEELFSSTMDFSIQINGIPNPVINIGCNCSSSQISELENMLEPLTFNYTGRSIDIRITNETITNINKNTNILFIFGYKNLTIYKSELDGFLGRGGTIFMLADITEQQTNDGYMNETFGLRWYGIGNPANTGKFYDISNVDRVSYRISKYFVNISGLPNTTTFSAFNLGGGINHIGFDNKTIVWDTSNAFSFVKINEKIVNGNGRTVWFNDYTHNNIPTNYLLKATIMWASGERYRMDTYEKSYPKKYTKAKYIMFDEDPYEIELIVWRVFY